jgi:hypothetical protein
MVLTVNNNPLMNVMDKMSNTCSQYWNSRSRSIITRLQQGDILTVTVPNGYVAWNHGQSWCLLDSLYRHRLRTKASVSKVCTRTEQHLNSRQLRHNQSGNIRATCLRLHTVNFTVERLVCLPTLAQ